MCMPWDHCPFLVRDQLVDLSFHKLREPGRQGLPEGQAANAPAHRHRAPGCRFRRRRRPALQSWRRQPVLAARRLADRVPPARRDCDAGSQRPGLEWGWKRRLGLLRGRGRRCLFPRCCCRHRGPPRTAATRINPDTIYVQLHSGTGGGGQAQRWTMPASWAGRRITAVTITPSGREEGRPHLSL